MSDELPVAEPDVYLYRSLAYCPDLESFNGEVKRLYDGQIAYGRWTIVSPEHPSPTHPDGRYFEGWRIIPGRMDPPHTVGPFNFPLTEVDG